MLDAQGVDEIRDVAGQQVAGDPDAGLVGAAVSPGVGGVHPVMLSQRRNLMPPHVRGLGKFVQQNHRVRPLVTGGQVVEPQICDVDVVGLDAVVIGHGRS